MASEEHEEVTVSVTVTRDLREWLDEQAAAQETDRGTVLERLLAAHRDVATGEADRVEDVAAVDDVDERLEDQRAEFVDLIEDVRKRVIQVKRETDGKAPLDDHESLAETLETVEEEVSALDGDIADLSAAVETVETDLEDGFENFEDVLEYLTDRSETLSGRLDTLARAVVDAREELRRLGADAAARAEADRLKLAASQHGVTGAVCEDCDASVDVALLTEAECPHCATAFDGVEPSDSFFGSNVLTTGEPPALEGTQETKLDASLDDLVEGEATAVEDDEEGES